MWGHQRRKQKKWSDFWTHFWSFVKMLLRSCLTILICFSHLVMMQYRKSRDCQYTSPTTSVYSMLRSFIIAPLLNYICQGSNGNMLPRIFLPILEIKSCGGQQNSWATPSLQLRGSIRRLSSDLASCLGESWKTQLSMLCPTQSLSSRIYIIVSYSIFLLHSPLHGLGLWKIV